MHKLCAVAALSRCTLGTSAPHPTEFLARGHFFLTQLTSSLCQSYQGSQPPKAKKHSNSEQP